MNGTNYGTIRMIVAHLCALAVGGLFVYAAYTKIIDVRQFRIEIANYKILPDAYTNLPAIFMPWLETLAGIALIVPRTRRAGAIIISGLLLFFIGAIFYSAIIKGLNIECGCFGKGGSRAGWMTILRDLAMLLATVASVFLPPKPVGFKPSFEVLPAGCAKQPAKA